MCRRYLWALSVGVICGRYLWALSVDVEQFIEAPSAPARYNSRIMSASSQAAEKPQANFATATATRHYFERLAQNGIASSNSVLGQTGLTVSKIGFGGYRIHEFDPDHREALKRALLGGCNLIDTSTNYTDGSSERLVGEVIRELIDSSQLRRDEVVIITKVGYVQGENLKEAKANPNRYKEMVEFQTDCWHNLSPQFLADQITKSLGRMALATIDFVLLHNPEYYLKAGGTRDVYYQRIERAFQHLETEVQSGRIRGYGVSSNTFGETESRSDFTSLPKVLRAAESLTPPHHFRIIQFPFNLFEAGGALNSNSERESALHFAKAKGLGVLTNRPFNGSVKGRLVRLTSFPTHEEVSVKGDLHIILGRAIEMEKRCPGFPKTPQGLQWAHALRDRLAEIDDLLIWKDVVFQQIYPTIRQAMSRLPKEHESFGQEYTQVMQELLRLVTWDLENLAQKKAQMMSDQVNLLAPELKSSAALSQQALRVYLGLHGIGCVLVGMRTPAYVTDALTEIQPLSETESLSVLTRMQRHRS